MSGILFAGLGIHVEAESPFLVCWSSVCEVGCEGCRGLVAGAPEVGEQAMQWLRGVDSVVPSEGWP